MFHHQKSFISFRLRSCVVVDIQMFCNCSSLIPPRSWVWKKCVCLLFFKKIFFLCFKITYMAISYLILHEFVVNRSLSKGGISCLNLAWRRPAFYHFLPHIFTRDQLLERFTGQLLETTIMMRVATYNMAGISLPHKRHILLEFFLSKNVDIICLQEITFNHEKQLTQIWKHGKLRNEIM